MTTEAAPTGSTALTTGTGAAPAEASEPAAPAEGAPAAAAPAAKADAAPAEKAPDEKVAADKTEKAAAEKPAELELKLPDALKDDPTFVQFKALAKELKLDSQGAQKIADLYLGAQKASVEAQNAWLEKTQKGWEESLKADKELGGANLKASSELAYKAVLKFGSPELVKFLEETRLGNHPALVRAFHRIGKAMAEDSITGRHGGAAAAGKDPNAQLQRRYPSMFPKES